MTTREITYVPLATLQEDPRNPKAHDQPALTASLEKFSLIDPIVVDGRTGFIISGHGRREALLAMAARGDTPPEGITEADDGGWLVPVVAGWSSRTDAEAKAALIALNRVGELGGWVDEALLGLLDELAEDEVGLDATGFEPVTITGLRAKLDKLAPKEEIVKERPVAGREVDTDVLEFAHRCPSCGFEFDDVDDDE
jgi:ParB-like chromosome segregation protein Spo0J